MDKILKVANVEKYYGNRSNLTKAIDNISFDVLEGEFVGIMGASGSGKTTLLNCISTIDKVTSGHILINGTDVTELKGDKLNKFRREDLGFIFQDFNLLDTLTGYENIALALTIQGRKPKEIDDKIKEVAKTLNITHILNKYPYQMSGGEKQRVASARAIITNPKLILADEPTGALDSKSSRMLLEKLGELNKNLKATILMLRPSLLSIIRLLCYSMIIGTKYNPYLEEKPMNDKVRRNLFLCVRWKIWIFLHCPLMVSITI